jgi:cobalt-zinc-cadmium efflux system outer membrane protein
LLRCLVIGLAVSAPAVAGPLTLSAAVAELETHGFDLLLADRSVAQARGDLRAAGALPGPLLSLSAGPSLGCFGDGCRSGAPTLQAQLQDQGALSQLLWGKRALRVEGTAAALRASQASRDDVRRQLRANLKQQFVAALLAERSAAFAREVDESTQQTEAVIRARYRAGSVDDADVARVETQHLEAQQALDSSVLNLEQQRSTLAFLLGRGTGARDLELEGEMFYSSHPVPAIETATRDALVASALERRPDIAAQRASTEQADAALALLRRQRIPDVQPFLQFGQQGLSPDYSSPPYLSLGIAVPIPAYLLQGEIARAEATVEQQRVALEKARANVRADVEVGFAAFRAARAQAARMEQGGLLSSARRARALVSVQYDKGAASLIELLDAQRTFVATNAEYLQVVQSYWSAVFRLEAAVGQELMQ